MKTKPHASHLEARVAARNRVHQLAKDNLPAMIAALSPFVGKPVQLQTGCLAAKVKAALPGTPFVADGYATGQWFYTCSPYSLRAEFKVCECYAGRRPDDQFATYAEASFTIGDLDGHTLTKTCQPCNIRTDYTVDEVLKLRKELDAARTAMREAEAKLYCFGEYDN